MKLAGVVVALLVGALGCGRAKAEPSPMTKPISLDFTMKRDGGSLHLDYTIVNHSKDAILVRDVMVTPGDKYLALAPTAIIAVRGSSADEIRFVRGDINPDSKVNVRYPAGVRPLAAGQTLTGSAVVKLPLTSWHPYGQVQPLDGTPAHAVLEVQIYPATTAQETAKLADGGTLQLAARNASSPETLRAGPYALP